jgi:uncharacterized protein
MGAMIALDLSALEFALLAAACAVGGLVQGAIGFGFALIAVPMLQLLAPGSVPVAIFVIVLPLIVTMAVRERRHVDVRGVVSILAGRVVGTAIGAVVLLSVSAASLEGVIGTLIVAAAVMSAAGLDVQPTRWTTVGAGVVAGVMGTTSGIGGPALALVYQRRPGPELRSTLAVSFVLGQVLSVAALLIVGRVDGPPVVLGLMLTPPLLVGLWASGRLRAVLDRGWLRPAVLTFAAAGGVAILLRALSRT